MDSIRKNEGGIVHHNSYRRKWRRVVQDSCLLLISAGHGIAADLPELLDSDSKLLAAFQKHRDNLSENASCKVTVTQWSLPQEEEGKVKEALKLFPDSGSALNSPVAAAECAAQKSKALTGLLGAGSGTHWDVRLRKGAIRFEREFDAKTVATLRNQSPTLGGRDSWLYTTETIYSYSEDLKKIEVRPLNPFTEAYPLRLDILDLSLGLFAAAAAAGKDMAYHIQPEMRGSQAGFVVNIPTATQPSVQVSFEISKKGASPRRLRVLSTSGGVSEERCFDCFYLAGEGVIIPFAFSTLVIDRSNRGSNISLWTIEKLEHGKLTARDMSISAEQGVRISDETGPR